MFNWTFFLSVTLDQYCWLMQLFIWLLNIFITFTNIFLNNWLGLFSQLNLWQNFLSQIIFGKMIQTCHFISGDGDTNVSYHCLLCTGDISVSLDSTGPRPQSRSQTRLLRLYRRLHRPALTWPVHNIIISELNIAQWAQYCGWLQVVLNIRSCCRAPRQSLIDIKLKKNIS